MATVKACSLLVIAITLSVFFHFCEQLAKEKKAKWNNRADTC